MGGGWDGDVGALSQVDYIGCDYETTLIDLKAASYVAGSLRMDCTLCPLIKAPEKTPLEICWCGSETPHPW